MKGAVAEGGRDGTVVGPSDVLGLATVPGEVVGPGVDAPGVDEPDGVTVDPDLSVSGGPAESSAPGAMDGVDPEVDPAAALPEADEGGWAESGPGAEAQAERTTARVNAPSTATAPGRWPLPGLLSVCNVVVMSW